MPTARYDIYKRIDASYYGDRDDEDRQLKRLEAEAEQMMRAAYFAYWREMEEIKKEAKRAVKSGEVVEVGSAAKILHEEEEDVVEEERKQREQEEKEKEKECMYCCRIKMRSRGWWLRKKKLELLGKYASENLLEEQNETKAMLKTQR